MRVDAERLVPDVAIDIAGQRVGDDQRRRGDEAGIEAVGRTIPLGRMAQPQDIGDACLFLASSLASYVSGSTVTVHGGGEAPAFLSASNANNE